MPILEINDKLGLTTVTNEEMKQISPNREYITKGNRIIITAVTYPEHQKFICTDLVNISDRFSYPSTSSRVVASLSCPFMIYILLYILCPRNQHRSGELHDY
jgi:hypothetical protein